MRHHEGDTHDFDVLYDAEFAGVHRYATARLGVSDGEEVTADVFHAAAVAFADGKGSTITPAWLMAVAKNKVIDRWRRAERRKARAHLVWSREEPTVELADAWSRGRARTRVLDTLDQLPPRYRTLLILHYVDGMSVPEIAAAADESVRAIESALARGRRTFRARYGPLAEEQES